MANNDPVVLVHGIFGFGPKELGKLNYWGSAFRVHSPLQRHEASVGPISSAHDRACELAAQIKGTRVDYGEQHAGQEKHERYGYDYTTEGGWKPFVPDWSESKPIHLVGHSLGSPTIRCLQHLLEIDYWGWGSNNRWVKSISTISGVSNGSTLTYYFGADEQTGLIKKDSLGTALLVMIETYMYATHAIRENIYNFDLDHWGFERKPNELLTNYLRRVSKSNFFKGKDNACYTLTLQGAYADNTVWQTYPDTYYFSYVTEQTFPSPLTKWYYPEPYMNPAMLSLATYIGRKTFERPPIKVDYFQSADWWKEWWENDGAVPTYSQLYPRISGSHPVGDKFNDHTPIDHFQKGKWYYTWERGMDHLDVCISPQLTQFGRQKRFYINLFKRLQAL